MTAGCGAVILAGLAIGVWGPVPFFAIVGTALFLLVRWHANTFGYACSRCGARFAIGAWRDFLSPHTFNAKYLRCPGCGEQGWMETVVKERS